MGDVDERWGELENLRQKLEASEQEREQMLVALEDAHAEVRRLAEQVDRLQADNRFLTRSASELTGRLSQCQVRRPDTQPQNDAVHAQGCMAEELRVTIEELQVTAEDLEEANVALRELNQTLERRGGERAAALKVRIDHEPAVESLNVAVAAALCLFEQRRQRASAARPDGPCARHR